MNTPDCIKTRRSVRVFQDTPIPRQTMEQIVALASYAPSWKNTQVARYLVVDRREEIQAIAQTYATFNSRILSTCTALVAAQTFCLAAQELGVGTVILGIFDRAGLQAYLQIPQDRELVALIAAGYPGEEPNAPKRKPVEELLSYWDGSVTADQPQ